MIISIECYTQNAELFQQVLWKIEDRPKPVFVSFHSDHFYNVWVIWHLPGWLEYFNFQKSITNRGLTPRGNRETHCAKLVQIPRLSFIRHVKFLAATCFHLFVVCAHFLATIISQRDGLSWSIHSFRAQRNFWILSFFTFESNFEIRQNTSSRNVR